MDACVGLPLVEPLSIPQSVQHTFPFLVAARPSTFGARLYALVPAIIMTASPVDEVIPSSSDPPLDGFPLGDGDDSNGQPPTARLLRVEPREVFVGVSYTALFVCDFATSSVCVVIPFTTNSVPVRTMFQLGGNNNHRQCCAVPLLHSLMTAQDDESWVVLRCNMNNIGGGERSPMCDILLQIPAQGQRSKLISAVMRLCQHHSKSAVTSTQHKVVGSAAELRSGWEALQVQRFQRHATAGRIGDALHDRLGVEVPPSLLPVGKGDALASRLLVPLQARWVLNRRAPVVVDRMRQAREEYQAVEDATNAALAEVERDFDRLFAQLDTKAAALSVEDGVLQRWDRELEEKDSQRMIAEAELRRAKDAARQIVLEKERAIVRCTEELQSWRRMMTTRQQEELVEREALLAEEQRMKIHTEDAGRAIETLRQELCALEVERGQFETPQYLALVERRDAKLQEVTDAQNRLHAYEANDLPLVRRELVDVQRKITEVTQTNEGLRKLLASSAFRSSSCAADQVDLESDQVRAANDVVALEDALLLVDLEYAQARKERDAARMACSEATERIEALRQQITKDVARLRDPTARYRVAKLRMARARREQQGAELLVNRAASVHRSGTCELQQQILFEAIRLKSQSPQHQNGSTTKAQADSAAFTADCGDYDDDQLEAMLRELRGGEE